LTLPTFLGIGVPKAGTTWLYDLMVSHPEVYIPEKLKDIRYFNRFYDQGPDWYQSFFPSSTEAQNYKVIGEITAHYLYNVNCPGRMARDLEKPKLLLMLRNPIDRTWSHYKHRARLDNYQGTFESYLEYDPNAIRFSLYSENIKRFQDHFEEEQFLILLFDRVFADVMSTRALIAEFLEIDPQKFPEESGSKIINKGYIPRYRSVYAAVAKGADFARESRIYWPVHLAKKLGIKRLISVEGDQPKPMTKETRQRLLEIFDQEISDLEMLLQTDLSQWRE
jgi:hypothetical protein